MHIFLTQVIRWIIHLKQSRDPLFPKTHKTRVFGVASRLKRFGLRVDNKSGWGPLPPCYHRGTLENWDLYPSCTSGNMLCVSLWLDWATSNSGYIPQQCICDQRLPLEEGSLSVKPNLNLRNQNIFKLNF